MDKSDEGNYSCTATLDGIKEQQNVTLKIVGNKLIAYVWYKLYVKSQNMWIENLQNSYSFSDPISFSETPIVQSTKVGSKNYTVVCRVTGNPKPKVSWNVRGKTLAPSKSISASTTEKPIANVDVIPTDKVNSIATES